MIIRPIAGALGAEILGFHMAKEESDDFAARPGGQGFRRVMHRATGAAA